VRFQAQFLGGASSAVSSLFSNVIQNMWTNLAVNVGSGALSSGLVNEAMGGDFWSGAKHGALSGAVTWGVNQITPNVNYQKSESMFLAPIKNLFIKSLGALANKQKVSGKQLLGTTISSILDSTFVFDSKDNNYVKELKALGIEINNADFSHVEKTQTMEDGVVTTKFEIYVKKDLGSLSVEPSKNIYETSASFETNSSIIRMSVSVKSTGALTVDAHLGFENKYITAPYAKLNGESSGSYSRDTTPGIESIPHLWRRYQWDTTVTKGHALLEVGINYRPTTEPLGNWASTAKMKVKIDFSNYLK
jgi:hypothetical protein